MKKKIKNEICAEFTRYLNEILEIIEFKNKKISKIIKKHSKLEIEETAEHFLQHGWKLDADYIYGEIIDSYFNEQDMKVKTLKLVMQEVSNKTNLPLNLELSNKGYSILVPDIVAYNLLNNNLETIPYNKYIDTAYNKNNLTFIGYV